MRIFLFFLLWATTLQAQTRFKPFRSTDFTQLVKSEHFDVYCKQGNEDMAARVAKYAEMARGELGYLYDYQPTSRYILLYADNAHEILTSNYWEAGLNTNTVSGYIALQKLDAVVVLPENTADLYMTVKQAVSDVLLKEFDYGQELPSIIQNELLSYQVPWFYEGITDFVGYGWTYKDEMRLRSLNRGDLLRMALEGDGENNRLVRKSIWFFIAHEYGPQKFAELLYIAKLGHSSEESIISVLGIPLSTFTDRWREFLFKHADELRKGREEVGNMTNLQAIPMKKGMKLLDFAYSETAKKIAFYLAKKGKHYFQLYDIETGKTDELPITSGYKNDYQHPFSFHYPIAFSQDGLQVYTTQYIHNQLNLVAWNIEKQEKRIIPLDPSIQSISSFTFSHDGKKVVISVVKNGKSDIMLTNSTFSDWKMLTNDIFDDISPTWSYDDEILYFSSNRDTTHLEANQTKWDYFKNDFDVFAYHIGEKKDKLTRITNTPLTNEIQINMPNSYEITYLSEESGVWDLHSYNIFQGESAYLTKTSTGIEQCSLGEQNFAFSAYQNGEKKLYLASYPQNTALAPPISDFRQEYLRLLNQQTVTLESVTQVEIVKTSPLVSPQKKDTTATPLRYYIFDDAESDDHSVTLKKIEKKDKTEAIVPKGMLRYQTDWKEVVTENPQKSRNQWRTEYLQLQILYHPLPRSGIALGTAVHDALQHHRFTATITPYFLMLPFVQFGNTDAQLRYTYQKHRLDLYAEVGGWRRLHEKEGAIRGVLDTALYRFAEVYGKIGATYPLSSFWQVGTEQSLHFIQKQDLRLVFNVTASDARNQFVQSKAYADFNNVHYQEDFPYKGTRFHSEFNRYSSLQGGNLSFQNVQISLQHYQPIWKKITLAANLNSLFSFGGQKQTIYLGGIDNWFLGILRKDRPGSPAYTGKINTDLTSFAFQEFAMPIRGFWFNARSGTKYVVSNFDLRVPFAQFKTKYLNDKPLYAWEWVSFFDIGTTWRTGNPLSQKNPTDIQTIFYGPVTMQLQTLKNPFLMGFGTGAKVRLLNYTVRSDLAWGIEDNTLQKPIFTIALGRAF